MKKCCSWLPEALAIGGVAIGIGVAFQGWPAWPKADGATWASWVQAVGTVAAIIAAYFEGRRQAAAALRAARESASLALKSKRASVLAVVEAACGRVDEICSVIQPTEEGRAGLWLVYHASIVESMTAALTTAPVYELESASAVESLLRFRDQFVFFGDAVGRFHAGPQGDDHFEQIRRQYDLSKASERQQFQEAQDQWYHSAVSNIRIHVKAIQRYRASLAQALGGNIEVGEAAVARL
ncbi:hypothetical protein [Achromobacter xylosoxidans]|uniref:hypothetical protein n=1 Tax=Alcaligenes xylosoxydans xylosoxydans TaxID=85698 RepID=UPI000A53D1B7|nr:hypothetical protein [Achromobacter xylosoxidans]